jgi:hypothetical protein
MEPIFSRDPLIAGKVIHEKVVIRWTALSFRVLKHHRITGVRSGRVRPGDSCACCGDSPGHRSRSQISERPVRRSSIRPAPAASHLPCMQLRDLEETGSRLKRAPGVSPAAWPSRRRRGQSGLPAGKRPGCPLLRRFCLARSAPFH